MKPNKDHVERALKLIQGHGDYEFFFNNLNSPDWLEPLIEAKIYSIPEDIKKVNETIIFPTWAPTKFLVKIANDAPEKVLKLMQDIPETDNPKIHADFIDAAANMPSKVSIALRKKIIKWLDNPYKFIQNNVAKLIVKYYGDGFDDEALKISQALFEIKISKNDSDDTIFNTHMYNEWEYNDLLGKILNSLKNTKSKFDFTKLLIDFLEKIINYENLNRDMNKNTDDSFIWRISIGEEKNVYDDLKDLLINRIRDIGIDLVRSDTQYFDLLLDYLVSKHYPIFIRISIYLVWKNIQRKDLVLKVLTNSNNAASKDIYHEYSILLRDSFSSLDEPSKNEILYFIDNLSLFEEEKNNEYRKYRLLYLIRDHLKDKWLEKLNSYKSQYGEEIKHPEYLFYSYGVTQIGPRSPITFDELNKMTLNELYKYLSSWSPPVDEQFGEYSYGLSQEIEKLVLMKSDEFSNNIDLLKFSNLNFVRAVIYGFNQALNQSNRINFDSVLSYLFWCINETKHNNVETKNADLKKAACELLQKLFSTNTMHLNINHKSMVWKIIEASLNDHNPDSVAERSENIDYHHIAINSARGIALETAIRYGLWIMRISGIKEDDSSRKNYPELFKALDKHLDLQFETSKAIRSVYGVWLPWLLLLDSSWVRVNLSTIFPDETTTTNKMLRKAAWEAYLLYSQPSDDVFVELKDVYLKSINNIEVYGSVDGVKIANRFIEHIVVFYLRGLIPLGSEILRVLYSKINLEQKSHVIDFMGRILNDDYVQRAKDFLDWRISECLQAKNYHELIEFGWWMNVKELLNEWMLDRAIVILENASTIKPSHSVVEALIPLCSEYPEKVLQVFKLIVDKKVNEYGFFLWRSAATYLIPLLLNTPYKNETVDVINKLGAYGLDEFGIFIKDV